MSASILLGNGHVISALMTCRGTTPLGQDEEIRPPGASIIGNNAISFFAGCGHFPKRSVRPRGLLEYYYFTGRKKGIYIYIHAFRERERKKDTGGGGENIGRGSHGLAKIMKGRCNDRQACSMQSRQRGALIRSTTSGNGGLICSPGRLQQGGGVM